MSKSLWSRSVWNSLFNRVSGSRPVRRRRNSSCKLGNNGQPIEALETRIVLAGTSPVSVSFDNATNTLSLVSAAGATNETVTVKAGVDFTDVLVNGTYSTRMNGVTSATINTITFNGQGNTATGDSLSVTGISNSLTVTLTGVEKLQLNTGSAAATTTVTADGGLSLATSNVVGALSITTSDAGNLTQTGAVLVSGTTTINLNNATPGDTGDIILSNSGNSFGTLILTADDITLKEAGPTAFGTTTATGNLVVTSTGAISDGGNQIQVTGNTTLKSSGNAIDFTATNSTFGGTLNLYGSNINITDSDAGGTDLGTVTASGSFDLTSRGNVTHLSGKVNVGGLMTITAKNAASTVFYDVDISSGSNNFGSVNITGNEVTVSERSATNLAGIVAKNSLTVTSNGAITDSGLITVGVAPSGATAGSGGDATFSAKGQSITLDGATNTYWGTVTFTGGNVIIIDNDGETDLGASKATGNFALTTSGTVSLQTGAGFPDTFDDATIIGGVTQSGALTVNGRITVTATGITVPSTTNGNGTSARDIALDNSSNKFGSVAVFGKDVTINEKDATDFATSTTTADPNTPLLSIGDLTVISGGTITDSGVLTISGITNMTAGNTGTKAITLDSTVSTFGDTLQFKGTNVDATDNDGSTDLGATTVTGNFNLTSNGSGGTATGVTNVAGTVGVTGRFTVHSYDSGAANGLADINVQIAANNFGSISFEGDTVQLQEAGDTALFDSTADGSFTLTSSGHVTDIGTIQVEGATNIVTGATKNITLDSALSEYVGSVKLDGNNILLTNDTDTDLNSTHARGTLTVKSTGQITDAGGSAAITADSTSTFTAADDITLNNINNVFSGAINLDGSDATLTPTTGTANVILGTVNVDSLSITTKASGTITDTGVIKVDGATSLDTDGTVGGATGSVGLITLDSAGNKFGTLQIVHAAAVTINESNDTDLVGTSVASSLQITSAGHIADDDALTPAVLQIGGTTTLRANGGDIDLQSTTSFFSGTLNLIGASITLTDADTDNSGSVLGEVRTTGAPVGSGDFDFVSTGPITQTAAGITVLGNANIIANTAGASGVAATDADITLQTATNTFATLTFTGKTVKITEADATELSAGTKTSRASGNLEIASGGNIFSTSGVVTVDGNTDLNANSGNSTITLDNSSNYFGVNGGTGTLKLQAGNASIYNANGGTGTILANGTTISSGGTLTLTSNGSVTQSSGSTVIVPNLVVTTITPASQNVILSEAGNKFDSIAVTANNVDIEDSTGGTVLNGSTANGTFTLTNTAGGNVSAGGGALVFVGTTTIITDNGAGTKGDISLLDVAGSRFATAGGATLAGHATLVLTGKNIAITSYQTSSPSSADILKLGNISATGILTIITVNGGTLANGYDIIQGEGTAGAYAGSTISATLNVDFEAGRDLDLNPANSYGTVVGSPNVFLAGRTPISY